MSSRVRDFLPGAPEPAAGQPAELAPFAFPSPLKTLRSSRGNEIRLYPTRVLAAALERTPGTIREWEYAKVLPAPYIFHEGDPQGRRRLYSEEMILKLRRLAAECGLLPPGPPGHARKIPEEFPRLAELLFEQIKEAA